MRAPRATTDWRSEEARAAAAEAARIGGARPDYDVDDDHRGDEA